jgi:hypothetical protein
MKILSNVTIKNYTLPLSDGTAGQVAETDGAGNVTFQNAGLTYFSESENTSAPNGTVNVQALTVVSGSTNSDFAIIPKGTGALISAIPDNTATGGQKRGDNAVDLQVVRATQFQVASGIRAFLGSGKNNQSTNTNSFVGAGESNGATGVNSVVCGGLGNVANNTYSSILGGYSVIVTGLGAQGGGYEVNVYGTGATGFGYGLDATSNYSSVFGKDGSSFLISGRNVLGGQKFSTIGDKQVSNYILGKRTTDATPTTLTTDNGAGYPTSTTNEIVLRNNQYIRFKGTIIVKETGTTNVASWDIDGTVVRGATAGSTVVNVANVTAIENVPAYTAPTITADTANGSFVINVTGVASTNLQWVSSIKVTELIY